ncbi:MAG: ATP-binding protein, partial [Caldisericum exile]|uniref:ATP-binding protein n=1 Tax=Caldisericum exile TaxID=693075 RepID=UPI003C77264D
YRKHWSTWEAIRELFQNALDSDKNTAKIYKENGDLIIEDKGRGMQVKHLLLGISDKEDKENARGQFGEGLKIALIVLKRLGYDVEIISNNLHCTVDTIEIEGEKCLKINYEHNGKTFNGTQIIIHDYDGETYQDRFVLGGNKTVLYHNDYYGDILEKEKEYGELFVKDIYVTKIGNSEFSYNLKQVKLEESRNIADEWSLRYNIGYLFESCIDKQLWIRLFKALKDDKYESNMILHNIYNDETKPIIIEAFKEVFPDSVALTNPLLKNEVLWRNKEIVTCINPQTMDGIINVLKEAKLTDIEFLKEHDGKDDIEVNEEALTETEKENLAIARQLCKMVDKGYDVKPYIMGNNDILGVADNPIKLNRKILNNKEKTISTVIHELTHLHYGIRDMTVEQIHKLSDMAALIIGDLIRQEGYETTLLESKIGIYRQYRVSVPIDIVKAKGLKKGDKVKVKIW